jgi:hypothetical protein
MEGVDVGRVLTRFETSLLGSRDVGQQQSTIKVADEHY